MRRLLAPIAVLATAALLFASVTPAAACVCANHTPEPSVSRADFVVVGSVTKVVPLETGVRARVSVERYLKGSGPTAIEVIDRGGGYCGFLDMHLMGTRNVLMLTDEDGEYRTWLCGGNITLPDDESPRFGDGEGLPHWGFFYQPYTLEEIEAVTGSGRLPNDAPEPVALPDGQEETVEKSPVEIIDLHVSAEPTVQTDGESGDALPRAPMWAAAIVLPLLFLAASMLLASRRQ